ncbi:Gryzun, putative trafficking through golgi-domain-containing protein [Xylariaceae sp. FL1019]|nr:Gryzun, putative trafficking through golgi-domain-containing protein [Xylariaceae sp. FL1019]
MDAYPPSSLDHNVPFLAVSGLGSSPNSQLLTDPELQERANLVRSELPPIQSKEAKAVLRFIQDADAASLPWATRDPSRRHRFKIKTIGRDFLLPPRRAKVPDDLDDAPATAFVLHSPFSPLSPGSTLYPDGLIDVRWIQKHQEQIPSICLCFYELTSDPTLATLHDNQLKTDINAVKNAITQSGYKCRLTVVILSDQSPSGVAQFQDRLENIRRSTSLDPKASLFVMPTRRPDAELEIAVGNVLNAIYDQAVDYYRDLGRHSRKKRGRGIAPPPTVPPTSGTSHTLSLQDWNVRYDFKTAVFAEFRQDFDAALRSYEQAYETLLGADVLELIPAWNSRFNDARLLADILAIRALKCLLLSGQSTAAVRRWQAHHDRICDIVDRKGRGTNTYGFKAWQATWSTVMANLIDKVNFPELNPEKLALFRPPEKNLSAERLQPWELLHHSGYWYRTAAHHLLDRRKLALLISEDDRKPPERSVQAGNTGKAYTYDTYLCPEPYEEYPLDGAGVNHAQLIYNHLMLARAEFQKRRQMRVSMELTLACCKELEKMGKWQKVVELLILFWRDKSFWSEMWSDVMDIIGWTLRNAAVKTSQMDLIVAIDWELMNKQFTKREDWHYNVLKSLEGITADEPPVIHLDNSNSASALSTQFTFKNKEGKAGETCPVQLELKSDALPGAAPIPLQSVDVYFEGGIRTLHLNHDENSTAQTTVTDLVHVPLREADIDVDDSFSNASDSDQHQPVSTMLEGAHNLIISPGQTRVFEMDVPLREAGDALAVSVKVTIDAATFMLKYTMRLDKFIPHSRWHRTSSSARQFSRSDPRSIHILPRPPKMQVEAQKMLDQYYANEAIQLHLDIVNNEDSEASAKMEVFTSGSVIPKYAIQLAGGDLTSGPITIESIKPSEAAKAIINLEPIDAPAELDVTIKVSYHLVTDPSTPIVQEASFHLPVVAPFEYSYELQPRLHSEWPSLFNTENIQDSSSHEDGTPSRPRGLAQKWALVTRYASFAHEDVSVLDLDIQAVATQNGVSCAATKTQPLAPHGQTLGPKTMQEAVFHLTAQKTSLDDRSPASADLAFIIKWRRASATPDTLNITTLPLPRHFVTTAEPRVLASISYSSSPPPSPDPNATPSSQPPQLIFLDLMIENPSAHFLTFGITMDPSDEFAFSGAKIATLNVLPLARRSLTYRLVPMVDGKWIRPMVTVRDKYFQKVLKILPTEGVKGDKEGILLWVPPNEDVEGSSD